jgi:hypothetical protein
MDCNRVTDNRVQAANGMFGHGAAILQRSDLPNSDRWAHVELQAVTLAGNRGHTLIRSDSIGLGRAAVYLLASEMYGNTSQANLIELVQSQSRPSFIVLHMEGSSIAGNSIGGAAVLHAGGIADVINSIVWQPGRRVFAPGGSDIGWRSVSYSMLSDADGIFPRPDVWITDPRFVGAGSGDLRLALDSPALDFAPATTSRSRDGGARPIDLPLIPDLYGPLDLGAFERRSDGSDTICCAVSHGD